MPTVFSAAQLAASATAGDPRTQDSFVTTAEWHAYQAEWFKTVTMGEDLPPVGGPQPGEALEVNAPAARQD